jgi:hypothetical protein
VVSPRAEVIHRLFENHELDLLTERRHLAYSGRHVFVAPLHIGEGMLDMARNIPREHKIVVGVTAALAVKPGIHPDHIRLLLNAANRVHRKGGLLERPGQFPSEANLELPLHEQAARYLRVGPSWLERTFPFWVAGILDRLVFVVLPVATLLLPLFGLVLPLLDRRHRGRIARYYERLRELAIAGDSPSSEVVVAAIDSVRALRLQVVEDADVPIMYLGDVFHLTMHIDAVLEQLERRRSALVDAKDDGRRETGGRAA